MNAPAEDLVAKQSGSTRATSKHTERMLFLDGLRGLACIWILLFHISKGQQVDGLLQWLPSPFKATLDTGWLAIVIFFVLSGFVINFSLHSKPLSGRFFAHFVAKRSVRLDPPYWVSIIVTVAVGVVSAALKNEQSDIPSVGRVLAHMFYLQDILNVAPIGEVYWTLAFEIQMYLSVCALLVMLAWIVRTTGKPMAEPLVFGVALAGASLYPLGFLEHETMDQFFFPYAYLFLAGVLISRWHLRPGDRTALWMLVAQFAVLGVGTVRWEENGRVAFTMLNATVIVAALRFKKMTSWMSSRPWQFLGNVSYSLYLLHVPVLGPLFWMGFKITGNSLPAQGFWFVAAPCLCVAIAWLFNRTIEQPAMRLAGRIPRFDKKNPTAAGKASAVIGTEVTAPRSLLG